MIDLLADVMPLVYLLWGVAASMVFCVYAWPVSSRVVRAARCGRSLAEADWLSIGIVLVSGSNTMIRFFWAPWYAAGIAGFVDLQSTVAALSWALFFPAIAALAGNCSHLHARFLVSRKKWIAPSVFFASLALIGGWALTGGSTTVAAILIKIARAVQPILM